MGGWMVVDCNDPFRLRIRQGAEQGRIHDAEDRSVGAESQRQCESGHGGETRITTEHLSLEALS